MKRLLSVAAFSALTIGFTACHNTGTDKQAAAAAAHQATIDSMKMELAKHQVVDSMQALQAVAVATAVQTQNAPVEKVQAQQEVKKAAVVTRRRKAAPRNYTNEASGSTYHANSGYAATPAPVYQPAPAPVYEPAPAPAPAKKGWSAKAKGAVIGAGAGAVGGAIINKRNRGVGAIIGGLGGAAIGTGVGAVIDHKNGR